MTNLAGNRIAEIDYGGLSRAACARSSTFAARTGQTYLKHICWDGAVDVTNTQNVAPDITRVYAQFGVGIPLEAVNGLVRCVHPGAADHVSFGTVLDVGFDGGLNQSYLDVEDLEGRVLDAIKEIGCDLTILCNYGNVAPPTEPVTSGHWDEVTYDSLTDTTTFKDNSGTFPAHAIDWWVQPDAGRSNYLDIVNISASEIVVAGNATGLAHGRIQQPLPDPDILGTFYTIVWPVGVDPATGTLAHDDPCNPASRLLFAGYYYMPPVAGTTVPPSGGSPGVYGQQPGGNFAGDYYCWNRVYDPSIGRWTTPDPAARPWSNLVDYANGSPTSSTDSSGLSGGYTIEHSDCPDNYDECFEDLSGCLFNAIQLAKTSLINFIGGHTAPPPSLASLQSGPVGMTGETAATAQYLLNGILKIEEDYLLDNDLSFECHCCPTNKRWLRTNAFTHPDDDEINLCQKFFSNSCAEMALTMFHELTHIVLDSEDYAYSHETAKMAALPDWKRRKTADNWEAFLRPFMQACKCDCSEAENDLLGCMGTNLDRVNSGCPNIEGWQ